MQYRSAFAASVLASLFACGGSPPPATTTTPPTTTTTAAADAGTTDTPAAPLDKYAAAEAAAHVDPNEKEGPIDLTPLFSKATKPKFPPAPVGDHDCLKGLGFTGKHVDDFKTLVDKCGTPTGMLEYTKPAEGRLHSKQDKRDEFRVKVEKNMCYRYFAVGDDGIKDIDILVLRKGAMIAMDKSEQFIAVIDTDKLWCVDEDMDLAFSIEVDGPGAGSYTFGVWSKPKPPK